VLFDSTPKRAAHQVDADRLRVVGGVGTSSDAAGAGGAAWSRAALAHIGTLMRALTGTHDNDGQSGVADGSVQTAAASASGALLLTDASSSASDTSAEFDTVALLAAEMDAATGSPSLALSRSQSGSDGDADDVIDDQQVRNGWHFVYPPLVVLEIV
jgi:hypothetical protein